MGDKKFFDLLQVYRGIAAFLVVIHHTYNSFEYFKNLQIPLLDFLASIGKYGVDFFFVLSGFIIAYTTYQHRDNPKFLKKYTFNRIIRIYIPYLPISIGMLLLYTLMPGFSSSDRTISILTSLTLLPHGNPALSVAWTLVFEMFFYLVYGLNFLSKRIWYWFLTFWILSIIGFNIFEIDAKNAITHLIFNLYNLEFILGVFVAYFIKRGYSYKKSISLFFACFTFFIFLLLKFLDVKLFSFSSNLIFVFSMAWFVYLAISHWNIKINPKSLGMLIGNSSYSLYLLHNPIQSFLVKMMPNAPSQIVVFLEFMATVFMCCFISYLYYLVFEKRILNLVKEKFEPQILQ